MYAEPVSLNPDPTAAHLALAVRELDADLETPVSVYLKLAGAGPSFLLESVSGGEQVARYSFIGVQPRRAFILRDGALESRDLTGAQAAQVYPAVGDNPLAQLRAVIAQSRPEARAGLPRFTGGLVGYLGYDAIRFFEPAVRLAPHPTLPEAIFLQADILVAFDHAYGRLVLIANEAVQPGEPPDAAARRGEQRLDRLVERLAAPLPAGAGEGSAAGLQPASGPVAANQTQPAFEAAVRRAQEHIAAGDIFQVVLSQRLSRETNAAPFAIYRALRRLNPSPYMFYFDFANLAGGEPLQLIGASPELHVRLEGRAAAVRPIAGTRRRGANADEDARLEGELLADPKERAEHVMLVDLGRNDLGRVCEIGSIAVPEMMTVERYSHVMHIVSHVTGRLRPEFDAFDLLGATFPAGTVSGAPKVRAMQILNELEPEARGPYAGVVGYFSYDGSLDTCIAIRTLVMRGRTVSVQAGAGIVADSQPVREYQETLNKARALLAAVERAEARSAPQAQAAA